MGACEASEIGAVPVQRGSMASAAEHYCAGWHARPCMHVFVHEPGQPMERAGEASRMGLYACAVEEHDDNARVLR